MVSFVRSAFLLLSFLGLATTAAAKAPKPEKIRVAFGAWSGPGAGAFKSGLRSAIAKDCVIGGKKGARAIVEGVVAPEAKGAVLRLAIKAAESGELVESREFHSPQPRPSHALLSKIGRAVVEMVRRAPIEQGPQP